MAWYPEFDFLKKQALDLSKFINSALGEYSKSSIWDMSLGDIIKRKQLSRVLRTALPAYTTLLGYIGRIPTMTSDIELARQRGALLGKQAEFTSWKSKELQQMIQSSPAFSSFVSGLLESFSEVFGDMLGSKETGETIVKRTPPTEPATTSRTSKKRTSPALNKDLALSVIPPFFYLYPNYALLQRYFNLPSMSDILKGALSTLGGMLKSSMSKSPEDLYDINRYNVNVP